jgi:hypothetical protein
LVLLDAPLESDSTELRQARLHARTCRRCGDAYAREQSADAARAFALPTGPAPSLRIALTAVALVQMVLALPWLVGYSLLPDAHVAIAHLTRDGALGLTIAGVGLVTAWRPRYVHSTMLLGLLVFAAQVVVGLVDQQSSGAPAAFEVAHVLVIVVLFGLFAVAASITRRATPFGEPRSRILR